jgi:hypothetical protein
MPNSLLYSPGIDLITEKVAVLMQDRPVVGMSAWLTDALAAAAMEGRDIQLVTSAQTRLTWPVRSMLFRGAYSRWVITTDNDQAYDGLNGARLKWNGEMFLARSVEKPGEQGADIHPSFVVQEEPNGQLQLTVRVRHKPVAGIVLGKVAELLFEATTGFAPAGWATSEPVTQPWNPTALTDYCRERAPQPTWLVLAGQPGPEYKPAIGTLETRRTDSGLDETVTMAIAQPGMDFPPLGQLGDLVDAVADDFELVSASLQGAYGAADATALPRYAGIPCPIGIGIGNEAVRASTLAELLDVEGIQAQAIGPAHAPAVWYPIGDGRKPSDWQKYATLIKKLTPVQAAVQAAGAR